MFVPGPAKSRFRIVLVTPPFGRGSCPRSPKPREQQASCQAVGYEAESVPPVGQGAAGTSSSVTHSEHLQTCQRACRMSCLSHDKPGGRMLWCQVFVVTRFDVTGTHLLYID